MRSRFVFIRKSTPVTDIDQYRDFEHVMQRHEAQTGNQSVKRLWLPALVLTAIMIASWFAYDSITAEDTPVYTEVQPLSPIEPERYEQLMAVDSTSPPLPETSVTPEANNEENKNDQVADTVSTPEKEDVVNEFVYVKAAPVAGVDSLYEYFHHQLKYPAEHMKDSISGISLATFTIEANGEIGKIVIERSLGPGFDKEVIRLLENMPAWAPATMNGSPVKSSISLPFTFKFQ